MTQRNGGLADLHRHLDGSLRRTTVDELAMQRGLELPEPLHFTAGMGLRPALALFDFTLALLQEPDAVRRIAAEMCEDAAAEGVTTLEVRFAPQLHRGATPEAIVDAALEGIDGRAGLLLCGLYGEPPDVLASHVDIARERVGIVGIDLAGGPQAGNEWSLTDYAEPFRAAAEIGLGRTVHAGEGRPPAEIRTAIETLGAQRIGHGTTILDDPAVAELAIERGITIEACVTSNVHTSAIPDANAHPLPRWLQMGLEACVCTDNPLFSRVDAPEEHRRVGAIPGMDNGAMSSVVRRGHAAAFRRG